MASSKEKLRNIYGGGKITNDEVKKQQLLEMAAIAAQQLQDTELDGRFVPEVKGSKPTEAQQQFIDDFVNRKFLHAYCRGGNQCLSTTTLVATPDGPRKISELCVGDYVLDPNSNPIMVTAVHDNGEQYVYDYVGARASVTCTPNHKFLMSVGYVREIGINDASIRHAEGHVCRLLIRHNSRRKEHVFNITVDHPENLYQLANGLISKNSGKTVTCCYLCGKLLMGNLPNWERLPQWGTEPLLILYLSQNTKQIEDSIWRKMKTYLKPGTYRETRTGGALQRVSMSNGNVLIFFTYHNINDARAAVQSFTGHYVFIDELPGTAALIEEAQTRVIKNLGQFVCAFTPKVPAPEVKRIVETADPSITGFYRLKFDDNPAMDEQAKDAQHKKAAQWGDKGSKMILEGDWTGSELNIFFIDEARCCRSLPPYLDKHHAVAYVGMDPANSSGFGLVVLLYDKVTDCYYVTLATTLTGEKIAANSSSAKAVNDLLHGYTIVKRVCDPANSGFRGEAKKLFGWTFSIPNKQDTAYFWKSIEMVQEMLGTRLFFTEEERDLLDELAALMRSEEDPMRVVNRKKSHMVDALRYLVSLLPKPLPMALPPEPPPANEREFFQRLNEEREKASKPKVTNIMQRMRIQAKGLRL